MVKAYTYKYIFFLLLFLFLLFSCFLFFYTYKDIYFGQATKRKFRSSVSSSAFRYSRKRSWTSLPTDLPIPRNGQALATIFARKPSIRVTTLSMGVSDCEFAAAAAKSARTTTRIVVLRYALLPSQPIASIERRSASLWGVDVNGVQVSVYSKRQIRVLHGSMGRA